MASKGGHIVISVSVRPSIRPFVRHILFFLTGIVCVRFYSKTTGPISPMLIPIYRENNVDWQRILHFDLHPSMTAGQGHEILQFVNLDV